MTNQQAHPGPKNTAKRAHPEPRQRAVAPQRAKPVPKVERTKKSAHSGKDGGSARLGSKTAKILDLLKRPGGATLKEIMKATNWQSPSGVCFLQARLNSSKANAESGC